MSGAGAALVSHPDWITQAVGPRQVERASRLAWGFRNESWRVELAGGRDLAMTRFRDAQSGPSIAARTATLRPRLNVAGIPSPTVRGAGGTALGVLITDYVEGTVGADLLDEIGGPALIGSVLGTTWRRLAAVDPSGLDLDRTWVQPAALVQATRQRGARIAPLLSGVGARRLGEMVEACTDLMAGRQASFVHGDLVPVNMLVRAGELVALLDFEFARVADPLLDAAWFDSIVAFHHPAEHPVARQAFLAAAGLDIDDPVSRDLLLILPVLRYLEILDDRATVPDQVPHWSAMLHAQLARA